MAGFSVIRTPSGGSTRYWEFRRCILVTIQPLATSWQAAATGRRQQLTTKHQQNPPQTVKRSSQPAAGNRPLPAGFTLRQRHTGNILEPAPRRGTNFVADVRRDRSRAKARPTLIRVHSWFKTPRTKSPLAQQITPPASVSPYQKTPSRFPNRSRAKARPTLIRAHSCSFVVQKHPAPNPPSHTKPPHPLCLSEPKNTVAFSKQISGQSRTTLIRVHSCSFVVQNTPHQLLPRTTNHSTPLCLSVPKNTVAFSQQISG